MNVQFEENNSNTNRFDENREEKGLVGYVIKMGFAKNYTQANMVLLGSAGVFFVAMIFVIIKFIL
jgi:hypothetical protein